MTKMGLYKNIHTDVNKVMVTKKGRDNLEV